jgi:hypothetical protein
MKAFVLKIKGKDTIINCLRPVNNNTYIDGIIKGFDYNNISQATIVVQNICDVGFILPAQILFTQNDNLGSTFEASINDTLIPANSTVNVPVYYNGIYNGNSNDPIYNFVLNGLNISYQLIITIPDTIGIITDIVIDLGNRVDYTFVPTDFTQAHNDPDGDTLVSIFLFGNVGTITFNNSPYIANTEVFFTDIALGKLKHIAPDTNNYIESLPDYKVKDSLGNIIT